MQEIDFKVAGMTCQGCVRSVRNVLQTLPGVAEVNVSLEDARARVRYDEGKVAPQQFKEVVEGAGYGVVLP